MSITVTTDVFCDGCMAWIDGVTGPSVDRPGARARVKQHGWTHTKGKDYCPECSEVRP